MRSIYLNKGFSSFPDHFGQLRNFFQVGQKEKKIACWDKKHCFATFVLGVPYFYIWKKSRLKSRNTIVHLLQCKTNFFIRLSFWGRNLHKLNLHIFRTLHWYQVFFVLFLIHLHSSAFVYTCLHSPRLVYNRLDSTSDSSTFI